MFVDPPYRASSAYAAFRDKLGRGDYEVGQYRRIGKCVREVWIQCSYNPILNADGKPVKVVKYAIDITEQKQALMDVQRVLGALSEGDLTAGITTEFRGEFGQMCRDANSAVEQLTSIVTQIMAATDAIDTASKEIFR